MDFKSLSAVFEFVDNYINNDFYDSDLYLRSIVLGLQHITVSIEMDDNVVNYFGIYNIDVALYFEETKVYILNYHINASTKFLGFDLLGVYRGVHENIFINIMKKDVSYKLTKLALVNCFLAFIKLDVKLSSDDLDNFSDNVLVLNTDELSYTYMNYANLMHFLDSVAESLDRHIFDDLMIQINVYEGVPGLTCNVSTLLFKLFALNFTNAECCISINTKSKSTMFIRRLCNLFSKYNIGVSKHITLKLERYYFENYTNYIDILLQYVKNVAILED